MSPEPTGNPNPSVLILVPFRGSEDTHSGNEVTAQRWQRLIASLGYRTRLGTDGSEGAHELILALHAVRSEQGMRRALVLNPRARVVLALTGTDLHSNLDDPEWQHAAHQSMALAHRLLVLNHLAAESIPRLASMRSKTRVIPQSAAADPAVLAARAKPQASSDRPFQIVQLAHLRSVKRPFLLPEALSRLPQDVRISGHHAGAEIERGFRKTALDWQAREPRYHYLGPLSHRASIALLAEADLLVLTSASEGGPNVFAEALVHDVPVLATPTRAARSLLGEDYPGLVPFDDPAELASRLHRLADDPRAYRRLAEAAQAKKPLVSESHERHLLAALLEELCPLPSPRE